MMQAKFSILFVDDDQNIITGLSRVMHRFRQQWDLYYALSGPQALDLLRAEHINLVVTDMRMPEMSGLELLRIIAHDYPAVIRFILSGHADEKMILDAVNYAHQYMAKPFEVNELIRKVERIQHLSAPMQNPALIEFITSKEALPSLPEVYAEINQEINSDDPDPGKMGAIIERDASLTANVLKLVNSSFFGLRTKIKDAHQACAYLGMDIIRTLVLSEKIFCPNKSLSSEQLVRLKHFKVHSLQVSSLTQKLARYFQLDQTSCAMAISGGVLHNIGQLVLLTYGDSLDQIMQSQQEAYLPLLDAEIKVLGTTHSDIGAYLLGIWGLLPAMTDLIALHHQPSLSEDREVTVLTCLHLANTYVHFIQDDYPGPKAPLFDLAYLDRLSITDQLEDLKELLQHYYEEISHET